MSFIASAIRSVEYGSITLSGVTSNTASITPAASSTTVLVPLGYTGGDSNTDASAHAVRIELTSGSVVTAYVTTAPGTPITVKFMAIYFHPRFIKSTQIGNRLGSGTITITSVVAAKTWLIVLGGNTTSALANSQEMEVSATLTNATTVTIAATASTTAYVSVVEFR